MNIVESLAYLKAGLVLAGLPVGRVLVGMEMSKSPARSNPPSASVYPHQSRMRRERRRVRIDRSQLPPGDQAGALRGERNTLLEGMTEYEVLIEMSTMAAAQQAVSLFLGYLVSTPLTDAAGNVFRALAEGTPDDQTLILNWNDHDEEGRVTCTFILPLPGIVWQDHPIVPVDITVQYVLEGGNPNE